MTSTKRQLLRAGLAGFVLAPLCTAVWAERDDGAYRILQARYGTADRHEDVTQQLRELARRDERVRVTNDLFGVDPAPGHRKVLRILARGSDGQVRTFDFEEYNHVDGRQFIGWGRGDWGRDEWRGDWHGREHDDHGRHGRDDDGQYQILQARYGTERHNVDVTARLKQLARADVRVRISNDLFGQDPAPGRRKTLRIYARDRDGVVRTFEYEEYGSIDGHQFTGWGRGNWGDDRWQGDWGGKEERGELRILRAIYGAHGRDVDITDRLRRMVRRADRLEVRVDNQLAGRDPAPGERKSLFVIYSVGRGPQREVRVSERDMLRIP